MVSSESYKDFIAKQFVGKRFRFTCDCIVKLDVSGIVADYEISSNEIIYIIKTDKDGKIVRIGENTPKLRISVM